MEDAGWSHNGLSVLTSVPLRISIVEPFLPPRAVAPVTAGYPYAVTSFPPYPYPRPSGLRHPHKAQHAAASCAEWQEEKDSGPGTNSLSIVQYSHTHSTVYCYIIGLPMWSQWYVNNHAFFQQQLHPIFIMMCLYATAFSGSMATVSPICILIGLFGKVGRHSELLLRSQDCRLSIVKTWGLQLHVPQGAVNALLSSLAAEERHRGLVEVRAPRHLRHPGFLPLQECLPVLWLHGGMQGKRARNCFSSHNDCQLLSFLQPRKAGKENLT